MSQLVSVLESIPKDSSLTYQWNVDPDLTDVDSPLEGLGLFSARGEYRAAVAIFVDQLAISNQRQSTQERIYIHLF